MFLSWRANYYVFILTQFGCQPLLDIQCHIYGSSCAVTLYMGGGGGVLRPKSISSARFCTIWNGSMAIDPFQH